MYQFTITENEAGQRFDKYLHKLLPLAPSSFFYKMLRKKNITVNGQKTEGSQKLVTGDLVSLFLSEETFRGFRSNPSAEETDTEEAGTEQYRAAFQRLSGISVLYENAHMVLLNKPTGMLSQKAERNDLSLNEWLIGYLLAKGTVTGESLTTYKPSICNRLDRNTSGLVICACSLTGSQILSEMIRTRQLRKFYRLIVKGQMTREATLEGYLFKNEKTNQVTVRTNRLSPGDAYIKTRYNPKQSGRELTYLEVELCTGKTHQIRAHLASVGHPLLGDYKYGDRQLNDRYRAKYGVKSQLLHACRLEFPPHPLLFPGEESGPVFEAREPAVFGKIMAGQ